jgi:methylated-DNA-[protein]-cysteine S-methyltransferase
VSGPVGAFRLLPSPVGPLFVAVAPEGLCAVAFAAREPVAACLAELGRRHPELGWRPDDAGRCDAVADQLRAYFAGRLREFRLPVALRGSAFQLAVWRALQAIPYGETRSYGQVAAAIGRPTAARAVGAACAANPVAIVVPCHRVIGRDGALTGFGGGLDAKRLLLAREGRGPARTAVGGA